MYKLLHTHTKSYLSQNNHALSWAIHIIQVSPQCQAYSKSRDSLKIHIKSIILLKLFRVPR